MRWRRRGAGSEGELTAFIDEASAIDGRSTFGGTAMINGRFRGEIVSTDTLIVGETAVIDASIEGVRVLVRGQVEGSIVATERVELRGRARVTGDLQAPVVVVEEGVLFEGRCRMSPAPAADVAPARDLSVVPLKR